MSFDFNPNVNLSNVQASHKPTDGGGGNTGYFQRNTEENEENSFYFKKNDETDSFTLSIAVDEEEKEESIFENIKKFFQKLIEKIKQIFKTK